MARTIVGPGAHSSVVAEVQRALLAAGFDPLGMDQLYGRDTAAAALAFQQSQGLAATGVVDDTTWGALTHRPIPATNVRCLELTAAFEGHNYTLAVGNFDGAWLTWGIIGFTMKHGEVQKIILGINAKAPALVSEAFGDNAAELLEVMNASPSEQQQWANAVTVHGRLAEPWRSGFDRLGRYPEVMEEQRRVAHDDYFAPALALARRYKLGSELGLALSFDIQVQDGGIKSVARQSISQILSEHPPANELALRQIIANAVADAARPKYREDVRQRKLTVANGQGTVHQHNFILENWGLAEIPAPDLA